MTRIATNGAGRYDEMIEIEDEPLSGYVWLLRGLVAINNEVFNPVDCVPAEIASSVSQEHQP